MLAGTLMLAMAAGASAKDDSALAARVQKAHDQVGHCLAVKKGSDLDALASELSALKSATSQQDFVQRAQMEADERFVVRWRDFLNSFQLGNRSIAYDILYKLLKEDDWPYPIPRSRILERLRENHAWRTVSYATNTLGDLPNAIVKLRELESALDAPGRYKKGIEGFQKLIDLWEGRGQLSAEQIVSGCKFGNDAMMGSQQFKLLILSYALSDYLKLDEKYKVPPKKGEPAPVYLLRLREMAIANNDLVALWRISMYYQYLTDLNSPVAQSEQQAMEYALRGQSAQAGKKDLGAAVFYRSALQFNGNPVTVKVAKDGLLELQRSSPEAYAQALFMMAPPPTQREMGMYGNPAMQEDRRSAGEQQLWTRF